MENLINDLKEKGISYSENEDMSKHSTMRIGEKAMLFIAIDTKEKLLELLKILNNYDFPLFIIGDGSNTAFVNDYQGIILKLNFKGIEIVKETDDYAIVRAMASENWHNFVEFCVDHGFAGLENLALIPGTVGAAPVQNIAAYGQNQVDVFEELTAIEISSGNEKTFNKEECEYEYRTSIFKKSLKDKYIITSVSYRLSKHFNLESDYHDRYLSLESELKEISSGPYTLKDVFNAVISIRHKKLPKVEDWGTLGSFFKNPIVTKEKFKELSAKIKELQSYPVDNLRYNIKDWEDVKDDYIKIPAGRLLDELGWKNKWIGNIGTFEKHALCVITNGKGTAEELKSFVEEMKKSVKDAYDLDLEQEVNLL